MEVYRLTSAEPTAINALSDLGWYLVVDDEQALANGFPILVAKDFYVDEDCSAFRDIAIRWLEKAANSDKKNLDILKKCGFRFKRFYSDSAAKHLYQVVIDGDALLKWRLEVNWYDKPSYAYVTFGDPRLQNAPALANAEVIEATVPHEILEEAIAAGALVKEEYKEEE